MIIPSSLRIWFWIHGIVDFLFAIPLFLAPTWTLALFDITAEPLSARLIAAALFAIGGSSLLCSEKKEQYQALLKLKLIWSSIALLALLLAIIHGAATQIWFVLLLFLIFFFTWWYYWLKLKH